MTNLHKPFFKEKTLKKVMTNLHKPFFKEKTLKKVMEKAMLFLPVFVLLVSMVCAGDGWEDINSGNGSEDVFVEEVVIDDVYPETEVSVSSGGSTKFTRDFYIALVVSGVGILIILLFLYLFLRGPKNKWDKKN